MHNNISFNINCSFVPVLNHIKLLLETDNLQEMQHFVTWELEANSMECQFDQPQRVFQIFFDRSSNSIAVNELIEQKFEKQSHNDLFYQIGHALELEKGLLNR